MAITAAIVMKGLYEVPGLLASAKGLIGMLGGGSDKDEAARGIASIVARSARRKEHFRKILVAVGDELDPAIASQCQYLLNESEAEDEEYMGIAERLSGKKAPIAQPPPPQLS